MIIQNEHLAIREITLKDKEIMAHWLSDPRVLHFYEGRDNPHDEQLVAARFINRHDETARCIVEYKGRAIGYIQFYPVLAEERKIYGYGSQEKIFGTDQFIGEPDYWNKGIGTELVKFIKPYLFESLGADRIVMDPQTENKRAVACYEKCGYRKVKLLEKHELHEGKMRDCWLMECRKV
ncbi:Bifunctional AAC/APH [Planococcus massiliensis]|uniref:Bifunctional AAC/APH n=1 Tax=Planococcus massiliensis TaxID=1499687 RepID=A0A098EN83_9BACL|nr:GNAT family N-acetyltransferase [Planococcus massiliensis]CEG23247.1 Bifunctional AAC/APH [Planococcus massiliensis]